MSSILSILAVISGATGILLLWLVLRKFFSVTVSTVTTVLIIFGTNYFRKIFFEGSTPHNYLFTLFAAVLLFTINWQQSRRMIWLWLMLPAVLLACFLHDLSMFIRFIPLLCGIYDKDSWSATRRRIREQPLQYLLLLLIVVMAFGLTRFSWFAEPGTAFYFGDKKASVYPWIAANIYLILFSFNKGWLIYTPMMLLVLPGMYLLADRNKRIFYGVFLFIVFWFLLAASHPMWATGRGFGQRFFIETYAVLAIPLGYLIQWMFERRRLLRYALLIIPLFFLLLNLFQTWQYTQKILAWEHMNRDYYWAVFGRCTVDEKVKRDLIPENHITEETIPENVKYKVTMLENWNFDTPEPGNEQFFSANPVRTGAGSWLLSKEKPYSHGLNRIIANLSAQDTVWIRTTAWVYFSGHPDDNHLNLVSTCNHNGAVYKYIVKGYSGKLQPDKWNYICFDYQLPLYLQSRQDLVQVYFWNYGNQDCYIDDFTIELFEPEMKHE